MKEKYKVKGKVNQPIEINLSRADISSMVGTAVENFVRFLRDFKEEGLIEIQGRKIKVLDLKRLIKVAKYTE